MAVIKNSENLSLTKIKVNNLLEELLIHTEMLEDLSKGRVLHTDACIVNELVKMAKCRID